MPDAHPLAHLVGQDLVAFVGAGVSAIPPTCLPSWHQVNAEVLSAIGAHAATRAGAEHVDPLVADVRARQASGQLPPEYQADILARMLEAGDYLEVLRCLDGDTPGPVHLGLAALARAGRVKAIVTTNFDRVLESALRRLEVPHRVLYRPSDFAEAAASLDTLDGDGPLAVLKIHGSAESPETLIDTLAQRIVGFPAPTLTCLRHLLGRHPWLFCGYSGADLAAQPEHLCLRADVETARGFTWLVRAGDEPLPAVAALAELYGERGRVARGDLPGCLAPLLEGLDVPLPEEVDLPARQAAVAASIAQHTRHWAESFGPLRCVNLLAGLTGAGDTRRQAAAMLDAARTAASEAERSSTAYGGVCINLAQLTDNGAARSLSLLEEARDVFARARRPQRVAQVAVLLGELHTERGEYDQALATYRAAQDVLETQGDDDDRAMCRRMIGSVHLARGELDRALELYRESHAIEAAQGDELDRGESLARIAHVHLMREEYDAALEHYRQYAAICQRLGRASEAADARFSMGNVYHLRGDPDQALAVWREVLAIRERMGQTAAAAATLGSLGLAHVKRDEPDQAEPLLLRARDLFAAIDDRPALARAVGNLGLLRRAQGRLPEAADQLREAVQHQREMNNPAMRAAWLDELARVLAAADDREGCQIAWTEALEVQTERGDIGGAARICYNLAVLYQDAPSLGLPWALRALELTKAAGRDTTDAASLLQLLTRRRQLRLAVAIAVLVIGTLALLLLGRCALAR